MTPPTGDGMAHACRIVHRLPGRIRFRVDRDGLFTAQADRFRDGLQSIDGVMGVRLNRAGRSVAVRFDPAKLSADRVAATVRAFVDADDAQRPEAPSPTPLREDGGDPAGPLEWSGFTKRELATAAKLLGREAGDKVRETWQARRPHRPRFDRIPRFGLKSIALLPGRDDSGDGGARAKARPAPTSGPPLAASDEESPPAWHAIDAEEIAERLEAAPDEGLRDEEAGERLRRVGPNALAQDSGTARWRILANQFNSLPTAMLGGSAIVSLATGGRIDAAAIAAVLAADATVGFVTEHHAERSIASLLGEQEPRVATVVRDGRKQRLAVEQLVPGDRIELTPGVLVPADARLIRSDRLAVDESTLTGESMPVSKTERTLDDPNLALSKRENMVYRDTVVTGGRGAAVVVATGTATEVGRIQGMVATAETPETPIQRQLNQLGTTLGLTFGGVCAAVFGVGMLRGYGTVQMLKSATSLAVAGVPEGLPMVATTTLSLGVKRMQEENVLVRRLDAVEAVGAVQCFCLDKTGTITHNRMAVARLFDGDRRYEVAGGAVTTADHEESIEPLDTTPLRRIAEIGALCTEATVDETEDTPQLHGSPTECALVRMALDTGLDLSQLRQRYPRVDARHRTEQRGYMATLHDDREAGGRRLLAVKGRPADVLGLCDRWQRGERIVELTDAHRAAFDDENDRMAGAALRVLAFAYRADEEVADPLAGNLILLGLCGIADPIREGLEPLMRQFHRAGIRTVMITGDQAATGRAIARRLDLSAGEPITTLDSERIAELDENLLRSLAGRTHVFAEVSPSDKLQIVRAMQRGGEVVAMTGDGVNDGPALKAADVGVAMGGERATEVARMTSDVVLTDNNLQTMVAAIRRGRAIYLNTRNTIHFLLSTNMSEVWLTFAGIAGGIGQPLNPMQLLWINVISDVAPIFALGVQPPEDDLMDRPPRNPNEPFLRRADFTRLLGESGVMTAASLTAYVAGLRRYGRGATASTMAFHTLSFSQLLHMLSARSAGRGLFTRAKAPPNPYVTYALGGSIAAQLVAQFVPPLRRVLGGGPLGLLDLGVIAACSAGSYVTNELMKTIDITPTRPAPRRQAPSTDAPANASSGETKP